MSAARLCWTAIRAYNVGMKSERNVIEKGCILCFWIAERRHDRQGKTMHSLILLTDSTGT